MACTVSCKEQNFQEEASIHNATLVPHKDFILAGRPSGMTSPMGQHISCVKRGG